MDYSLINFLVIGLMAGIWHASVRSYKDSLFEKFEWGRYFRSWWFGLLAGGLLFYLSRLFGFEIGNGGGLFLAGLGLATLIVEIYKLFFRDEDQSKYVFPSYISWFGKPVSNRSLRAVMGVGFTSFMLGVFLLLKNNYFFNNYGTLSRGLIVGLITGLSVSGGGGYKDSPFEGFLIKQFFRSWWIDVLGGVLLSLLIINDGILYLAVIGFDRLLIETYKCLMKRNSPPGKFKTDKILFPGWQEKRKWLLIPYGLTLGITVWLFWVKF